MKVVFFGAIPQAVLIAKKIKEYEKNFELLGFIDNDKNKWGNKILSFPVFGGISEIPNLVKNGVKFCNLITHDTITRFETGLELIKNNANLINFIHPEINLDLVTLGIGNYIQEQVDLQADVSIGNNSSVYACSFVAHNTRIGNSVIVTGGCHIAGGVNIEDGAYVGTGAVIIPNITVGKWSVIGAGAVVLKDVPPYSVVVGNPARVIKNVEKKYDSGDILI